jgi:hypothetical protein
MEANVARQHRSNNSVFPQEPSSPIARVALYARVSTLNNQDPEMQLAELREYVGRRGWDRGTSETPSQTTYLKTPRKQPLFGDELVTSFCRSTSPTRILCKNGFGKWRGHATNAGYGLTRYRESKRNGFQPNRLLVLLRAHGEVLKPLFIRLSEQ